MTKPSDPSRTAVVLRGLRDLLVSRRAGRTLGPLSAFIVPPLSSARDLDRRRRLRMRARVGRRSASLLIVDGRRRRSSEQGRLLGGELLVGEHAALVQLAELLQLLDRLARGARSGERGRGPPPAEPAGPTAPVRPPLAAGTPTASCRRSRRRRRSPPRAAAVGVASKAFATSYSGTSGSESPRASMISGAAATTFGPPTCGATARRTPRMSSALAPPSIAFATCHA